MWAKVIFLLGIIVLLLLLILLLIEITVYFQKFMSSDHIAASTAIGTLITGIITAFAVIAAFIAGYYAKGQLDEAKKTAYGDFLLHLDEMFRYYESVHTKLHPKGNWSKGKHSPETVEDWVAVSGYMGLFERIQLLLENDIIKELDTADRLYGYRLFNIVKQPIIYHDMLVERGSGWIGFIKLWEALSDLESNKDEPKPDQNVLCHLDRV